MLEQPRPSFLDLLDSMPERAFVSFYSFARALLKAKPPRLMFSLNALEIEDITQEIILHCVRDDFRVLRQYKDRGRPFSAWFYVLAHNKCMDYVRKRRRYSETISELAPECGNLPGSRQTPSPTGQIGNPERDTELMDVLKIVTECISKLGRHCQLLLQLAADEYKPSEMALALGWPRGKNKVIADDLRECRRRLRRMVAERGVDVTLTLPR